MPRNYVHKNRGKTMNYGTQQLADALKAYQNGMSIRQASKAFSIPKSTLADRDSGRFPVEVTHGRPCAIPLEVENKIVQAVKVAAERGIGISRKQLMLRANVLCQRIKVHSSYTNFKAGKNWWEGLKKRHNLTLRQPERLGSTRARMMNRQVVGKYFDALSGIVQKLNLSDKPQYIWNCDETGKNFEHNPVKVVSGVGASHIVSKTSAKSTNITIMACVNADGKAMPPMFVVKGKTPRSLYSYNTKAAPKGTRWAFQEKGWMTDDIGEQWFNDVFLANCGPHRPQLLILDGHSSHESLAILMRALEENIHILALPPHTTHHLQPLDKSVFGPFNKAYNTVCSEFLQDPLHIVTKWTFPALIASAWMSSLTEGNIKSGFSACGIYPFNPQAISQQAYAPSAPTDCPLEQTTSFASQSTTQSVSGSLCNDHTSPTETGPVSSQIEQSDSSVHQSVSCSVSNTSSVTGAAPLSLDPEQTQVIASQSMSSSFSTAPNDTFEAVPFSESHTDVIMDPVAVLDLLASGDFIVEGEIDSNSIETSLSLNVDSQSFQTKPLGFCDTYEDPLVNSGAFDASVQSPTSGEVFLATPVLTPGSLSPAVHTPSNQVSPSADWNFDIEKMFLPPVPPVQVKTEKVNQKKPITSHRLLTSEEIIREKMLLENKKALKKSKEGSRKRKIKQES